LAASVHADFVVPNESVYLWSGQNYGAGVGNVANPLNKPGDVGPTTWTWSTNINDTQPQIDSDGRIYFKGRFTATPQINTVAVASNYGMFTASNNTNVRVIAPWATGQLDPTTGLPQVNNAGSTSGIGSSSFYRVSGTQLTVGTQVGNPTAGTGINQSTTGTGTTALLQNNQLLYTGPYASPAVVARTGDSFSTLWSSNDWTVASTPTVSGNVMTTFQSISSQSTAINSSGTVAFGGTLATVGLNPATPAVSATTTVAGTTGDFTFLGTKSATGAINVIARAGDLPFGPGGPQFNSSGNGGGSNGVGGFNVKINQNGQVAYDAAFLARGTNNGGGFSSPNQGYTPGPGGVTTTTKDSGWIYTPGAGGPAATSVQFYQSGTNLPTNASSNGTATWSGTMNRFTFSNAGVLWQGTTTGGDSQSNQYLDPPTNTQITPQNLLTTNTGVIAISTVAGGTTPTWMLRQNDIAPGFAPAANVRQGTFGSGGLAINNDGKIAYVSSLQGAGVTPTVAPVYTVTFPPPFGLPTQGPPTITPGSFGNDTAIFAGMPGVTGPTGLHAIARKGELAPGFGGLAYDIQPSSTTLNGLNNAGDVLFSASVVNKVAGEAIDAYGPAGGALSFNALFGYSAALDQTFPMLYRGQSVEVSSGVFKYVLQFAVTATDNGNGSSLGLSDNGQFVAYAQFGDTPSATASSSYGYIVMTIPAAGTGSLSLLGLAVMGRRRRR
jgi:hypothetical protein